MQFDSDLEKEFSRRSCPSGASSCYTEGVCLTSITYLRDMFSTLVKGDIVYTTRRSPIIHVKFYDPDLSSLISPTAANGLQVVLFVNGTINFNRTGLEVNFTCHYFAVSMRQI